MVALFPVIGGIASVIIGESDLSVYLFAGCLSSCIGAAIVLGFGTKYQNIELRIKRLVKNQNLVLIMVGSGTWLFIRGTIHAHHAKVLKYP